MANIINRGLFVLSLVLIIYAWTMYYVGNWILSLAISASSSILIYMLLSKLLSKYDNAKIAKKKYKKQIAQLSLLLINADDANSIIIPSIPSKYEIVEQSINKLLLVGDDNTTMIYSVFQFKDVEIDQLLSEIRYCKAKGYKLIVLTNKLNAKSFATIKNSYKNVTIAQIDQVYAMLNNAKCLPELSDVRTKKAYKILLANALTRKQANSYFVSGIFIILSGFVSFFPIYSQIMGTILIVLGIYSAFNKTFNADNSKKLL